MRKSENGPLGSAIKNVSIAGMSTRMEEIIKYQDHGQELAKNSPTSMETILSNTLIQITNARILFKLNLNVDVTIKQ